VAAGGGESYYFKVLSRKQAVSGSINISKLDELNFEDEDNDVFDMGAAETGEEE
jgi:hypothetical protein